MPTRLVNTEESKGYWHYRARPKSPPNSLSPQPFTWCRYHSNSSCLFVHDSIAISSAIMRQWFQQGITGTAIISRPTEHTQVIASSFSIVKAPSVTARIIPASSLTGMKAPESPPTRSSHSSTFLTASFNSKCRCCTGAPQRQGQ